MTERITPTPEGKIKGLQDRRLEPDIQGRDIGNLPTPKEIEAMRTERFLGHSHEWSKNVR